MRVTRRQFITTQTAGLALAARRPSGVARAQAAKPITVAHSVSTSCMASTSSRRRRSSSRTKV